VFCALSALAQPFAGLWAKEWENMNPATKKSKRKEQRDWILVSHPLQIREGWGTHAFFVQIKGRPPAAAGMY
jgi:hypothetical protein